MKTKVLSNLESLGDMVGTLKGIETGLDDDEYMEGLIRQAHGDAAHAFDVAAAATGATGHLRHVFEFGTAGIWPGPARIADPTSPLARLWRHRLTGHGGNLDIGYVFRPANQPNPRPTTARTGVPSKYLSRLSRRKYVFWNRAFVMETGQTVDIKAENGNFLFVPFYGEPSNNPLNKRGYMMYNTSRLGPLSVTPGMNTQGTFSAFWMNWWGGSGSAMIEQGMRERIEMDINRAMTAAQKAAAAQPVEPPSTTNVMGASTAAWSRTKKFFVRWKGEETE